MSCNVRCTCLDIISLGDVGLIVSFVDCRPLFGLRMDDKSVIGTHWNHMCLCTWYTSW